MTSGRQREYRPTSTDGKHQINSHEEVQGSYRFFHLGRSATRLYIVVMFDLWEGCL